MSRRLPEQLSDDVVRIRRPNLGDATAVFAAVDASRPELERWMPWCTPGYSVADAEAWIMASAIAWPHGAECPFVIERCADGLLVGSSGVSSLGPFDASYELGYWVRSDCVGQGIARRAARLAADFAFEQLGAGRVGILAAVDNLASRRVAEALGAQEEGVLRSRILLQGVRHDVVSYGLLP